MASYSVNPEGVAWAQRLIDSGQYVLDSDWGKVQPRAVSRTPSSSRTRGTNTPSGTWRSPMAPPTRPRPGTRSRTATSAACTGWGSSPAGTGPPSGGTRTSNSPPTTCCSAWTARARDRPAEHRRPGLAGLLRGRRVRWPLARRRHLPVRGREADRAVDELPLAVGAPADMGDPDHHVAEKLLRQIDLNVQDARCDRSPCSALERPPCQPDGSTPYRRECVRSSATFFITTRYAICRCNLPLAGMWQVTSGAAAGLVPPPRR